MLDLAPYFAQVKSGKSFSATQVSFLLAELVQLRTRAELPSPDACAWCQTPFRPINCQHRFCSRSCKEKARTQVRSQQRKQQAEVKRQRLLNQPEPTRVQFAKIERVVEAPRFEQGCFNCAQGVASTLAESGWECRHHLVMRCKPWTPQPACWKAKSDAR